MKSFTAGKNEDGARLSRFVENVTSGMPKSLLYKAFRNKRIKVNGKKGAPDTRLCPGDLVELYINDEFFSAAPPTARPLPYKKRPPLRMVYEDENIAVSYSNFYVEKIADSSYLKTELLLKNKTDRILNIGCDSVIVNGCAVDISKFVEVPANCTFLHEWTNGADMFLKYRIDTVETFAMVFEYHNADSYFAGESIQTREIEIE